MVRRVGRATTAVALLLFAGAWLGGPVWQLGADEPNLVAADMTGGTTAADLAAALLGGGVSVSNATYVGDPISAGTFASGTGAIGFDQGVVLTSGRAHRASADSCEAGVEPPNDCDGAAENLNTPGDPDLDVLSGVSTFDATILEFDFVPTFGTVSFDYVFASEEYNEFVNGGVNDTFGFFVNGINCATVDTGSGTFPVSINTINGGNPFGSGNATNPTLFRNNDTNDPGPATIPVQYDGLTVVLRCQAAVDAGATNHIKLAIADGGDSTLDSAVFIAGQSLVSGVQLSETLTSGAQSGTTISVTAGDPVTSQASLAGGNVTTATGTVTYRVFADAACTTLHVGAGTKDLGANGAIPPSEPVTFTVDGTYYWQASYSGDGSHNADTSDCNGASVTVTGGGATTSSSSSTSSTSSSTSTTEPASTTSSSTSTTSPGSTTSTTAASASTTSTTTTGQTTTTTTAATSTTSTTAPSSTTSTTAVVTTTTAVAPPTSTAAALAGALPFADPGRGAAVAGSETVVRGAGFAPLSPGTVTITVPGAGRGQVLGTFSADALGQAIAEIQIPRGLAPGLYHVVLEGIGPDGQPRRVIVPVAVRGASGSMPRTGDETLALLRWGLLLLGLGMLGAGRAEAIVARHPRPGG